MGNATQWLPVAGFEGRYEVSDDGRVRNARTLRPLAVQVDRNGRPWVALWLDKRMSTHRVHRLMALAFLGAPPSGDATDACHNDGNAANNVIANLRWDTHANNMRDIVRHGTGRNQNTGKTMCVAGHDLTADGAVYVSPTGSRACIPCRRRRERTYRERKRNRA